MRLPTELHIGIPAVLYLAAASAAALISPLAPAMPFAGASTVLSGTIEVNQQPVVGARVHLLGSSTRGYGAQSDSLILAGSSDEGGSFVETDAQGRFEIDNVMPCNPNTIVYYYSKGGHLPGSNVDNPRLGLMAILGTCNPMGQLQRLPGTLVVDEQSTMRVAYALRGLAVDPLHVSSTRGTGR